MFEARKALSVAISNLLIDKSSKTLQAAQIDLIIHCDSLNNRQSLKNPECTFDA